MAFQSAFESFKQQWTAYPGAIDIWMRNFHHVEQLFDYGSAIRKIMYTTNAVERTHSSFKKVTKKKEHSLMRMPLCIKEPETK
ncbi:hypothetical protein J22TS1_23420 [Siminovitchia terrae]|nr:hypothetical protein J22TS1_23420 [Siminovitchia terrae]